MSDTIDPVRAFREALKPYLRSQLHDTQRIAGLVIRATELGWTPVLLAREASRSLAGVVNAGGVITSRLENCANNGPARDPDMPTKFTQPQAWCGRCDDPITRWLMDEEGRITCRCNCWTDPATAEVST